MQNRHFNNFVLTWASNVSGVIAKGFEVIMTASVFLMLLIIVHPFGLPASERPDFVLVSIALVSLFAWYAFKKIAWVTYCEIEGDDAFFVE